MKNILFQHARPVYLVLLFLLCASRSYGQLYEHSRGKINFVSEAPLELIQAETSDFDFIIDTLKREFAIRIPMQGFQGFNSPLQQEHFYENYIETDRFPYATFTGKILEPVSFRPDTFNVTVKGILEVHGKQKQRILKANLFWKNPKSLLVQTEFIIPLEDHDIEIPRVVYQKIAEEISVKFVSNLIPRKN